MTGKYFLSVIFSIFITVFAGCDIVPEAGSLELQFNWHGTKRPDFDEDGKTYYVSAYIENESGEIMSSRENVVIDTDGSFDATLEGLKYEKSYRARLDIRLEDSTDGAKLYSGVSGFFTIEEGKDSVVEVDMEILPVPGTSDEGVKSGVEVVFVDENGDVKTSTNTLAVNIRFTAENAEAVLIANSERDFLGYPEDVNSEEKKYEYFKLTDSKNVKKVESGEYTYQVDGWKLDQNEEGAYKRVFIQLRNELDEKAEGSARILFDSALNSENISVTVEPKYSDGTNVKLVISSGEELIKLDDSLVTEDDPEHYTVKAKGAGGIEAIFKCPLTETSTLSCPLRTAELSDGEYSLDLTLYDYAGNSTELKRSDEFTIDRTDPDAINVSINGISHEVSMTLK